MKTAKVAIVGFGTIGSGVARLLLEHKDRIAQSCRHARRVGLCGRYRPSPAAERVASAGSVDRRFEQVIERSGDLGGRRTGRRTGAGPDDRAEAAGKRQGRRHGQQGLAGRARTGTVRPGPGVGAVDRLRGRRGRRHSDHRRHQRVPVGQPDRVDPRDPQRHEQLHPHADGGARTWTIAAAVAEAQQRGYAEANPAMDVDGSDAAQKLAILAHLAFGAQVNWREIPRIGIDMVDVADMRYAKELGYSIKLLGRGRT